ncbi:MAG TPA: transaldolase [Steroidobacteraceae bacterium]
MGNPLEALQLHGQSVWLDYIRRDLITSGELQRLIDDGVRGVTSNPAIFEKAIAGSADYNDVLAAANARNADAKTVYESIAVRDIQDAADVLLPVYERTAKRDGYVSLEVSPKLARDASGTIEEGRRLWKAVARANLMIKVPATPEGIVAIRQLISEAVNVNVTLLFSQEAYAQVVEAYLAGLEDRAANGASLEGIASVASFFISRIDSVVDARIKERDLSRALLGKVAIANARLTYQRYRELFGGPRWDSLAQRGAQTQRVLWASTGTKDPAYRDVLYVEELIGPDTVNTMPPATLAAFRDHGVARASLVEDLEGAAETLLQLEKEGIAIREVTDLLLEQGVQLFSDAFDKLLAAVRQRTGTVLSGMVDLETSEPATADLATGRQESSVRRSP